RHCEGRSNPVIYRALDCFVPRNDGRLSFIDIAFPGFVIIRKLLNKFSKRKNDERNRLRLPSLRGTKQSSDIQGAGLLRSSQ
ncbi:MAG: hypothetical protein LBT42_00500, partial [Tannerella sp.]|nr:hypothetical protein [Tannerella sp.]